MDFGILSSAISLVVQGKNAVDEVETDFDDAQDLCREVVVLWERIENLIQKCDAQGFNPELRRRLADLEAELEPLLSKCRQILQWKARRGANVQMILRFQGQELKKTIKEVRTRLNTLMDVYRLEENVASGINQDEQTKLLQDLNQKLAEVLLEMKANRSTNNDHAAMPTVQVKDNSLLEKRTEQFRQQEKTPKKRKSDPVLRKPPEPENMPLTPFRPPPKPRPTSAYTDMDHTSPYTAHPTNLPWDTQNLSPQYGNNATQLPTFSGFGVVIQPPHAMSPSPWTDAPTQPAIPNTFGGPSYAMLQPPVATPYYQPPAISVSSSPDPWISPNLAPQEWPLAQGMQQAQADAEKKHERDPSPSSKEYNKPLNTSKPATEKSESPRLDAPKGRDYQQKDRGRGGRGGRGRGRGKAPPKVDTKPAGGKGASSKAAPDKNVADRWKDEKPASKPKEQPPGNTAKPKPKEVGVGKVEFQKTASKTKEQARGGTAKPKYPGAASGKAAAQPNKDAESANVKDGGGSKSQKLAPRPTSAEKDAKITHAKWQPIPEGEHQPNRKKGQDFKAQHQDKPAWDNTKSNSEKVQGGKGGGSSEKKDQGSSQETKALGIKKSTNNQSQKK